MTSEIERLRNESRGVSESSLEGEERIDKPHITAKGKEGKVLRKKLAIALGLRPSSSASTTSQSEGEEVQNVVNVFRKQVRRTVDSRSSNSPRIIQEREQESSDKSKLVLRKTVRKTTDISGKFVEEDVDDDFDRQETVFQRRSKEQHSMTAKKFETFDHHERRSHDATRENSKQMIRKSTTEVENSNEFLTEDINERERALAFRKTKQFQDNLEMREITDSGERLRIRKTETEDRREIFLKTESGHLEARNAKQNESIIASNEVHDLDAGFNGAKNVAPLEETFLSYGEQFEKTPSASGIEEYSTRESVKLLREKIRKNARARQVRRTSGAERGLEGKSRDNQNQEKIVMTTANELQASSSNQDSGIPIFISSGKTTSDSQTTDAKDAESYKETEKENMLDLKAKIVQKSKIPRRKSQTAKDGMGNHGTRVKFDENEGRQMLDAQLSPVSLQSVDDTLTKKISKKETESEKFAQQNPYWQKPRKSSTNLSQLLRKVSRKTDSTPFARIKESTSMTTETLTDSNATNKSQTSLFSDTTITNSRHSSRSVRDFDFDSFEAELSRLKASVFRTYEEFKDIRSMAHSVEEELNDLKSTYGVSYICMYGNQI